MTLLSEITRIQAGKESLKSAIETEYERTIPSSAKLDSYPDYMLKPGYYVSSPTSNGIYIKYTDGTYTDYNKIWSGKTPVGVAVKTSLCSLCLHPSEWRPVRWGTNNVLISGVTQVASVDEAILDFNGKASTEAAMQSSYKGTAFTYAYNAVYADGAQGWLPSCGEYEQMRLNESTINTAMQLIGGTSIAFSSYSYRASTQFDAKWKLTWSPPPNNFWAGNEATDNGSIMSARSVTDF